MSELFSHSPMPDSFSQTPSPSKASLAAVPPPPKEDIEVVIRTMTSDLELMAKSGGNIHASKGLGAFAQPGSITYSAPRVTAPQAVPEMPSEPVDYRKYILIAGGAFLMIVVFGAGYYVLPALLKKSPPVLEDGARGNATSTPAPAAVAEDFVHVSYLKSPMDELFVFDTAMFTAAIPYKARIKGLASTTPAGVSVAEIEIRNGDASVPWRPFTAIAGITLIDAGFWGDRFEEDFTAFAYRGRGTMFFPGYILKAKSSQSPLILRNSLFQLEASADQVANFFPVPPKGDPAGWTDTIINGEPARTLSFAGGTEAFYYGLTAGRFLIMSTSLEGYREAMSRLQ